MKKILVSLAAAGVLVIGVAAASVISSSGADAQEATTDDETTTEVERPARGAAVQEVLDELVASGDISQAQADTISAALEEKWAEIEANRPDHHHRRGPRDGFHLRGLLEDGVIDADELAGLPADHPFNDPDGPFADAAADGELTEDEIHSVIEQLRADGELPLGRGFGRGFGAEAPSAEGASV